MDIIWKNDQGDCIRRGDPIRLSQLGYSSGEKKIFTLYDPDGTASEKKYSIINETDEEKVFSGQCGKPQKDPVSDESVSVGDFSAFKSEGCYRIVIDGIKPSYPFVISKSVNERLFYLTMRSFYLQRCGVAIDDPITGISHAACHKKDGFFNTDRLCSTDTTGGWHDAGDYGKYVPSAAVAVAQILYLLEFNREASLSVKLSNENIGSLPDVLDELRFELEWLLKMQGRCGGVYHKVNTENFPGMVYPEHDSEKRLIYEIGTADTAVFAGCMALASRHFKKYDAELSERYYRSANSAGEFILEHRGSMMTPTNGNTGAYMPPSIESEQFWGVCEMFRLTGDQRYLDMALSLDGIDRGYTFISWDDTTALGIAALCLSDKIPAQLRNRLVGMIEKSCGGILSRIGMSGYGCALSADEIFWASAKNALAWGMNLVIGYHITGNREYLEGARDQIHYVLGRNPLAKSFVTGVGSDYPKNSHHRLQVASGVLIPGLLVGGPNTRANDGHYPAGLGLFGYIDKMEAYSCNEYAIDYNAPLVFLAGYFLEE
jgi:endoglucanase